ncbi:hypothetical protein BGX28_006000 [Mortierella sp. GBA30]|nr:hypothetical protein BGX28_006000 [Mortierella sp. GBA30]
MSTLAALVATALSFRANPTLRRYNDALAATFYHHGRLCASNQATVMVLVIVFVGIISYPGIVTTYNASAYAKHHSTSSSLSSASAYSTPSNRFFPVGNLDLFWTKQSDQILAPLWTEDPEVHSRNLPSTGPLSYITPVIINATDLISSLGNSTESQDTEQTPWSETNLLAYAAQIQRRLESIVVEYSDENHSDSNPRVGAQQKNTRLIGLRDICQFEEQTQTWKTGDGDKDPDNIDLDNSEEADGIMEDDASDGTWKDISQYTTSQRAFANAGLDSTIESSSGDEESQDSNTVASSSPRFAIRGTSARQPIKSGSKRLVSERHIQPTSNISAEYWLLAMAYFVMFLYISLSVGRVDLVKSKYGLGIAAVATVFVSLLMSIGLCSVFGVTLTLMPWEILPFMIIVVGVENINILVHAVVETSMDLPVKERVGRGLGTVGVSITMTLVAELCLLIVGAMTTIPAVQEFCTFAIAAVIMDYLLQMTFFITVISIDIRRLELSDLSSRPTMTYARYPFGTRHSPITKTGQLVGELESTRSGTRYQTNGVVSFADRGMKHRRSDSATSLQSDGDSSSRIVGVMAYLGYIYGTTTQAVSGDKDLIPASFWRIVSPEASSAFWSTVDPADKGGYLEIQDPVVIAFLRPFNSSMDTACSDLPQDNDLEECEDVNERDSALDGTGQERKRSTAKDDQLDPRRLFKLLRNALVFVCLFAFWLLRVFVIPSIILAAAILLLLSYLLSPQRKLLVDLQWTFPFIVLPGDYQSKRKLMMEELLAQEAKELDLDPRPCPPIPGTVETLYLRGHETDIDQMDVSPAAGLILTSSMDGVILLWNGVIRGQETPLARLQNISNIAYTRSQQERTKNARSKGQAVRCLRLDPSGTFAAAVFGQGGILLWRVDTISNGLEAERIRSVPMLGSLHELIRTPDSKLDASRVKATSILWEQYSVQDRLSSGRQDVLLIAGYRDGQVWQWDPLSGRGKCIVETNHRGGIAELGLIELDATVRQDLGLRQRTYLVAGGKDGGVQCWTRTHTTSAVQENWTMLWGHSGPGAGISISVLTLDAEVPMVACGYSNGAIKVWDLEQGNLVWTLSRGSQSMSGTTSGGDACRRFSRRFSEGRLDSHQPSHQGAITKLCFHALEVEDLFGEPAPRVWLIVSSGLDETVMVWVVEWEGLMALPLDRSTDVYYNPALEDSSSSPMMTVPHRVSDTSFSSQGLEKSRRMQARQGSRDWTGINGTPGMNSAALHTDFLGTLSSSLPAPRLVGFMKQRGGKSISLSNSCLYGVRRTESSSAPATSLNSTPKLSSHTSVMDAALSSQNTLRSRRRSDGHVLVSASGSQDYIHAGNGTPSKRGWELWEADLYQCIFKEPGLWSLDLTVRSINLQHYSSKQPRRRLSRSSLAQNRNRASETDSEAVLVNSNGSGRAVPDDQETDLSLGLDTCLPEDGHPRARLHRRPGSHMHQRGQRGYLFTTGSTKAEHPLASQPTTTGNKGILNQDRDWDDVGVGIGDDGVLDGDRPMLLPFVETKLVHTIRKQNDVQPLRQEDQTEGGRGSDMKDVVVGFGNYIKIVRLDDEDGMHLEDASYQ